MRPNLLVITTDQQFAGALSCAGNKDVHTPYMDRIASRGIRYEWAYCASPACVPSRTSYMTGRYPHETTVTYNTETHPVDAICGATFFREAGYDTGHVGKWHIPHSIHDQAWSGFRYIAEARHNEVDAAIPAAVETFLNERRENPFLLFASFVNPHDICEWARMASGYDERFKNGTIPEAPAAADCPLLPDNFAVPPGEPRAIREHQAAPGNAGTYPVKHWGGSDDARWRQYRWAYYRMVEQVDHYIGHVLAALEKSGQADHTAIVFMSDHGDGMGAHRWNQKMLFYEECVRVPFIVMPPGQQGSEGSTSKRLVQTGLDLFPTLFDLAGLPVPASMTGQSAISPEGPSPRRTHLVTETNLQPAYGEQGIVDGRMIRSDRYKYICYANGQHEEQLFDLDSDPGEMKDLTRDPGHQEILHYHRRLLCDFLQTTLDPFRPPSF